MRRFLATGSTLERIEPSDQCHVEAKTTNDESFINITGRKYRFGAC
jgi:hypothetical protein